MKPRLWIGLPEASSASELLEPFDLLVSHSETAEYLIPDPVKQVELDKYPKLKAIATPSTGTNHIDLKECERRGIKVYSLLDDRDSLKEIHASSEFAFQMILVGLRGGYWRQWKSYERNPAMKGFELYGKHVGIVGFGRIGQNVAKYLTAFGATWQSYDYGSAKSTLLDIFKNCQVVLLSMTLNEKSNGLITKNHLSQLDEEAILVNVARAELINQNDLENWAKKGGLYVADVLHAEVQGNVTSPLLSLPNCIITPHIAGMTRESEAKAMRIAVSLLRKEVRIE